MQPLVSALLNSRNLSTLLYASVFCSFSLLMSNCVTILSSHVHSSVEGQLGGFAVNILVHLFCCTHAPISAGVEVPSHRIGACLGLETSLNSFPQWLHQCPPPSDRLWDW